MVDSSKQTNWAFSINCTFFVKQAQLILEPFGSAPTLFNSSSTRFAKYVEMRFASDGELEGAKLHELMLEKSRVVLDFPNERNFLVFYYMLAGLDRSLMDKLGLDDIQKHKCAVLFGLMTLLSSDVYLLSFVLLPTRITTLPEGLTNYQLKQWSENFSELRERMLTFGFKDEVTSCALSVSVSQDEFGNFNSILISFVCRR